MPLGWGWLQGHIPATLSFPAPMPTRGHAAPQGPPKAQRTPLPPPEPNLCWGSAPPSHLNLFPGSLAMGQGCVSPLRTPPALTMTSPLVICSEQPWQSSPKRAQ